MSLRIQVNPNDEVTVDEVGGGGGNPNYVETITGYIESLIPYDRMDEIVDGINDGSLTVYIESTMAPRAYAIAESDRLIFSNLVFRVDGNLNEQNGINIQYNPISGDNLLAVYYAGRWQVISAGITVTLVIIHHPIPES